jgi:hypothetical protein
MNSLSLSERPPSVTTTAFASPAADLALSYGFSSLLWRKKVPPVLGRFFASKR